MGYVTLTAVLAGLFAPVLVAFLISRLVLARLDRRAATVAGREPRSTVYHAVRSPVLALGWIVGLYIATLVLAPAPVEWLERVHWPSIRLWLTAMGTLVAFYVVYRFLIHSVQIATHEADAGSALLVRKVAAVLFGVIAGITVLNQFDVEIGPVLASLGVAGLAAALALQDTLGNFFAGLIIAVDRPVRVGDYVRLEDGLEGHVISIGWRTTRIRPFGETMVIVPNSKLANSILTNSDYPSSTTRVYVPCGVSYESDLRQVERVAIEVAREAQESEIIADSSFQPFVIFDAFGDSNITFRTVLRVLNSANSGTLRSAFMKRLHERFAAEGIAMNYPVRKLMVDPQHPLHVAGVAVPATPPQPSA